MATVNIKEVLQVFSAPLMTPTEVSVTWDLMRLVSDPESTNNPTSATDGSGARFVFGQASPSTDLHLERWVAGTLVSNIVIPLPIVNGVKLRSSGFGLDIVAGRLVCFAHAAGVLNEYSVAIPDWVPLSFSGGGPGPGPGPGPNWTEEQIRAIAREVAIAVVHELGGSVTPQDIAAIAAASAEATVAKFDAEASVGDSRTNKPLYNIARSAILRNLPSFLQSPAAFLQLLKDGMYQYFLDRGYESATEALRNWFKPKNPSQ